MRRQNATEKIRKKKKVINVRDVDDILLHNDVGIWKAQTV